MQITRADLKTKFVSQIAASGDFDSPDPLTSNEIVVATLNCAGLDGSWVSDPYAFTFHRLLTIKNVSICALQEIVGKSKYEDLLMSDGHSTMQAFVALLNSYEKDSSKKWAYLSQPVRRGYAKGKAISERLGFIFDAGLFNTATPTGDDHELTYTRTLKLAATRDAIIGHFTPLGSSTRLSADFPSLSIVNIHAVSSRNKLEWYGKFKNFMEQKRSELCPVFNDPTMVVGDFNFSWADIKDNASFLSNTYSQLNMETPGQESYLQDGEPTSHYDHILLNTSRNKEFDVVSTESTVDIQDCCLRGSKSSYVSETPMSDHLMVAVRLKYSKASATFNSATTPIATAASSINPNILTETASQPTPLSGGLVIRRKKRRKSSNNQSGSALNTPVAKGTGSPKSDSRPQSGSALNTPVAKGTGSPKSDSRPQSVSALNTPVAKGTGSPKSASRPQSGSALNTSVAKGTGSPKSDSRPQSVSALNTSVAKGTGSPKSDSSSQSGSALNTPVTKGTGSPKSDFRPQSRSALNSPLAKGTGSPKSDSRPQSCSALNTPVAKGTGSPKSDSRPQSGSTLSTPVAKGTGSPKSYSSP